MTARDHDGLWEPVERVTLIAVAVIAAASGVLCATVHLAGRLFGGGAPQVAAGDLPGVLARLPDHLADPRKAFPPDVAASLPGPLGMYSSLTLILSMTVAVLLVVSRRVGRSRPEAGARLAVRRDLRGLTARHPMPGRITLGHLGTRLVVAEARHSLLVIGPPQTGKTTALAIPAILEWPGPVLITSSKTDVLETTRAARARRGEVMVYDPTGNPDTSIGWTPLSGAGDWTGAQTAARALLSAHGSVEGVNESSFWQASAEMMLGPLLLASAHEGGMRALITWLDAGTDADDNVADAIDQVGDDLAASAWQAVRHMEPRTRSSVTATARTVLGAWWDPGVLDLARPELTPQRLLKGAGSLFMVAPTHDQERLRSIFAGIVSEMTRAVYQHRARTGLRLDPGLLVVLDEAAHIAPVRNLPELAATGPEPGIQLVSIFHDAAQITAAYGRRAPTVVANHRARLYLPGIGDPDTLTHLSRALGDTHVARRQTTRGPAGASITTAEHQKPLMPAHELREMRDGQALLVYGTRPPARIQLHPWYRDRRLQALARGRR